MEETKVPPEYVLAALQELIKASGSLVDVTDAPAMADFAMSATPTTPNGAAAHNLAQRYIKLRMKHPCETTHELNHEMYVKAVHKVVEESLVEFRETIRTASAKALHVQHEAKKRSADGDAYLLFALQRFFVALVPGKESYTDDELRTIAEKSESTETHNVFVHLVKWYLAIRDKHDVAPKRGSSKHMICAVRYVVHEMHDVYEAAINANASVAESAHYRVALVGVVSSNILTSGIFGQYHETPEYHEHILKISKMLHECSINSTDYETNRETRRLFVQAGVPNSAAA